MFTLKISTANAAFDDEGQEIARILRVIAEQVLDCGHYSAVKHSQPIRDINGNTVGKWELK